MHLGRTDSRDPDTGDGRDQRVGRRDVSGVAGAPHHPNRGSSEGTGEGEHLYACITAEGRVGDDAVLDRVRSSRADQDSTEHLEDGTENHGLAIGNRSRGDTGRPGVRDIVCIEVSRRLKGSSLVRTGAVVVRVEQGEERSNGEDVIELSELGHLVGFHLKREHAAD